MAGEPPIVSEMNGAGSSPAVTIPPPSTVGGITFSGYGVFNPQPDITPLEVTAFMILIITLMTSKEPKDVAGFIAVNKLERHVIRS